jgi:hypothetical protein
VPKPRYCPSVTITDQTLHRAGVIAYRVVDDKVQEDSLAEHGT